MGGTRRGAATRVGLGSSLGIGTEQEWRGVRAGKTGVGAITKFDLHEFDGEYSTRIAGEVRGFDPLAFVEKKDVKKMGVGGFAALRALSTRNDEPERASRPFDKDRDGFVVGEGSGVLILEEYERAKKRGARIYAELVGYGMSADAYHITAPSEDGDGPLRVMGRALKSAGVEPNQGSYINAHGTSTPHRDKVETIAIKRCFGDHARRGAGDADPKR